MEKVHVIDVVENENEFIGTEDTKVNNSNKVACFFYTVGQIIVLASYVLGFMSINGVTINVLNFIDLVLGIFDLNSLWYYYVSNSLIGLIYILFGVKVIDKFFKGTKNWKSNNITKSKYDFLQILRSATQFLLISTLFAPITLTFLGYVNYIAAVIILCSATIFVAKYNETLIDGELIVRNVLKIIFEAVLLVFISTIGICDVVQQIIEGLASLSVIDLGAGSMNIVLIYEYVVLPFIKFLIFYRIVQIVCNTCDSQIEDANYHWRCLMLVCLVLLAIDLSLYLGIISTDIQGPTTEKIISYFNASKTTIIPLALLSVGGFVLHKISE